MAIGRYLKDAIEGKGLKQSHIAKAIGITPQIFGQILAEKRKIEISEFYDICTAIGEDPTEVAIATGIYKPPQRKEATA